MLENLTPKQLKFAQWYLAHKKMLRQLENRNSQILTSIIIIYHYLLIYLNIL